MLARIVRLTQRYLIPAVVVSIYYSLRFRCRVSLRAKIQFSRQISIGTGTEIAPFAVIQTSGGKIQIGANCHIDSFDSIATSSGADVIIGDHVQVGPFVTIGGSRRKFGRKDVRVVDQGYTESGLTIGNDVLIGAGACAFECDIGEGAVVEPGSVVTRPVPPYKVVAGTPARVVGERS
jgi:acetyltransferase-like isoleucine patch superfamily enzyme